MTSSRPVAEIVSNFFPRIFTTHRGAVISAFAILALLNLGAGAVLAGFIGRHMDLETMRGSTNDWLVSGLNIYDGADVFPDYPPHAIVVLSPLGLLPPSLAVVLWASLNIVLSVAASYLAFRAVNSSATWSAAALPITMCLAWGGFRTLLQFSTLALTLGVASMVVAPMRPRLSGTLLGLALIKPQVAIPFVLWTAFTRRWSVLIVAAIGVASGFALFCVRAAANPLEVIERYVTILRLFYAGDALLVGLSEWRPLFALAVPDSRMVDILVATSAVVMMLVIGMVAHVEIKRRGAVYYAAPSLVALGSLLTFYHLTYGFTVLLPLAAALVLSPNRPTLVLRQVTFWALYVALVIDVPGLVRRFGPNLSLPPGTSDILLHVDRVVFAALFVGVATVATKCHN